jgi:hypothetical protein
MRRSLPCLLLLLAACHSRIAYPPGGYPYPEQVPDKDTDFYYYPLKNKLSRRDSFLAAGDSLMFKAYSEPNLSIKPMPSPVYRLVYEGFRIPRVLIITLTQNEITVKKDTAGERTRVEEDTSMLNPMERWQVFFMDRNYPFNQSYTEKKRHRIDSILALYPELRDPAYYMRLRQKESVPLKTAFGYLTYKTALTEKQYQYLVDLINASGYWQMPNTPRCTEEFTDGDGFSLEANTPEKYNVVAGPVCHNDSSRYYKACQELVRYAGLEKMIHLIPDWRADTTRKPIVIEDVQLEDVKEPKPQKPKHQPIKTPLPN